MDAITIVGESMKLNLKNILVISLIGGRPVPTRMIAAVVTVSELIESLFSLHDLLYFPLAKFFGI